MRNAIATALALLVTITTASADVVVNEWAGGPPRWGGGAILLWTRSDRGVLTQVTGDLATIAACRRASSDMTSPAMCTSGPSPATTA
jgi:hypothetical protein